MVRWWHLWQVPNPVGPPYVTRCQQGHGSSVASCVEVLRAETNGWVLLGVHPDVGVAAVGTGGAGAAAVAVVVAGGGDPGRVGGGVSGVGATGVALTPHRY